MYRRNKHIFRVKSYQQLSIEVNIRCNTFRKLHVLIVSAEKQNGGDDRLQRRLREKEKVKI